MKVLITGGTGLVGTEISKLLLANGHEVIFFSRNPKANLLSIKEYKWDVDKGTCDLKAFNNVEAIINLAGAPVNQRWTPQSKSSILRSRTDSVRLLFNMVNKHQIPLKAFISASAVGFYPKNMNTIFNEETEAGKDFLARVCDEWENEVQRFSELNIDPTIIRIGVALSLKGGALVEMVKPVKMGFGSPLGRGTQEVPWIHLADLASMFVFALEKQIKGVYNGTAPISLSNRALMELIAKTLKKPFFMPAVPAFMLKMIMGESASIALEGNKVSSQKIENSGFKYTFSDPEKALNDLLKS